MVAMCKHEQMPSLVQVGTRLSNDFLLLKCLCCLVTGGKTPDVKELNKRTYADIMKEQNLRKEEVILSKHTNLGYEL